MPSLLTSSAPVIRLASITDHMATTTSTVFSSETVPQAPEDPLFGMMKAFREDTFPKKVDLGIGAYRDNNAKPWVLPVVQKVLHSLYLPCLHWTYKRRLMSGYAMTQISTTSTFQSPACLNSHQQLRSLYLAQIAQLSKRSG
jgi:hypothetical protein